MSTIGTKGARPIVLKTQSLAEFKNQFNALKGDPASVRKNTAQNTHLIANVQVPLFNGQTFDDPSNPGDPQRGHMTASTVVNFGKMANFDDSVLALLGTSAPGTEYTGNTGAEHAVEGKDPAPVAIDVVKNLSRNDGNPYEVRTYIDCQALASANNAEQDKARAERGLAPLAENAKGRLSMTASLSTTDRALPAMNGDRFKANVGTLAAENYLLTASKKEPDKGKVSGETIDKVGDLFTKEYSSFVHSYANKDCKGIRSQVKDGAGYKQGDTIPGTEFPSLAKMGISVIDMKDGSTVLAVTDQGADKAAERAAGLNSFNKAFSNHMSQKVNSTFSAEADRDARQIGNRISVRAYPVRPQDPTVGGQSMTLIQPSTVMTMDPYAGAVTRAYECATHNNSASIEQLYGTDVLKNAEEIRTCRAIPSATLEAEKQQAQQATKEAYTELHAAVDDKIVGTPEVGGEQFEG